MKKKIFISLAIVFVFFAVLFFPIPRGHLDDGGTRVYDALCYKIVRWNKIYADGSYKNTSIYFGRDRNKSIDELWEMEKSKVSEASLADATTLRATVLEIYTSSVLVSPLAEEDEIKICDKITFGTASLENIEVKVGDVVDVRYTGDIMESYPAQIRAISWTLVTDA